MHFYCNLFEFQYLFLGSPTLVLTVIGYQLATMLGLDNIDFKVNEAVCVIDVCSAIVPVVRT